MRRTKKIVAKGYDYKITIKISSDTKWLLQQESANLINELADNAMKSLSSVRFYPTHISKIKVT